MGDQSGIYRVCIGHLKLSSPLLVLKVVPDETRLRQLLAVTEMEAGSGGNAYQLFQMIEGFGPVFRPPSPVTELLGKPWARAGREEFWIDQASGEKERK